MIKRLKTSNGITLIALVITIIVLLILAGVTIAMLSGENGILNKAVTAKIETEKASAEEEIKLAAMAALAEGNGKIQGQEALDTLEKELKDAGYEVGEITKLPITVTVKDKEYKIDANGTVKEIVTIEKLIESGKPVTGSKAIILDENNDQIVVPVGFTIKSDSPTEVDKGIVVVAPDKSEFVWVPVENAVYDSKNANSGKIPTSTINGSETGYNYTPMAIEVDGEYKGLLYNFDATGGAYLYYPGNENYQGTASQIREPATLSSYDTDTTKPTEGLNTDKTYLEAIGLNSETFASEMTTNYNEMVESVKENKGFYVGRYETSLNDITGYAQSIFGAKSANAGEENTYRWYGLYQKEKEYSENNNITKEVGSSMIWGSQYDQMMIWMQTNGIDVTSKNPINLEGVTTTKNTGKITGTEEKDKLNNIYDLLGNRREWTLEANNTNLRINHGGYDNHYAPSSHGNDAPSRTHASWGSRLALYVK